MYIAHSLQLGEKSILEEMGAPIFLEAIPPSRIEMVRWYKRWLAAIGSMLSEMIRRIRNAAKLIR